MTSRRGSWKKYKRPRHISLPVPAPVNSKIYWRKDRMSFQRHNSHPLVTVTTVLATPQMYQHACSPSGLGARFASVCFQADQLWDQSIMTVIHVLFIHIGKPVIHIGEPVFKPAWHRTINHQYSTSTIPVLPIISHHIPPSQELIFWGPKGGTLSICTMK